MKRKKMLTIILLLAVLGAGLFAWYKSGRHTGAERPAELYYCPMHPSFTSDKPGDCAICGMKLVKKEAPLSGHEEHAKEPNKENKILYYRNPMNPQVTSPVPMKDQMGMDYVPVYAAEGKAEEGVFIDTAKQQYIGVKKGVVEKRQLGKEIRTVGKIAYDPELFVAQQEYLEALKSGRSSLLESAERKLVLMGMSRLQIQELAGWGEPDARLYLPGQSQKVWAYLPVYEYEAGLIETGQTVEAEAVAYPGEYFSGTVVSLNPVVEPQTHTIRVRVLIDDKQSKLKPEMFVNARIKVDLGERLAVPEEAVLDTGERRIVFVVKGEDKFAERNITLGIRAGGYYEVLQGLKEGETVVISGNFLIDSESRLKSAIGSGSHQHGN